MAIACSYIVLDRERIRMSFFGNLMGNLVAEPAARTTRDSSAHEPADRGAMNSLSLPQAGRAEPPIKISETTPESPRPAHQPEKTGNQ